MKQTYLELVNNRISTGISDKNCVTIFDGSVIDFKIPCNSNFISAHGNVTKNPNYNLKEKNDYWVVNWGTDNWGAAPTPLNLLDNSFIQIKTQ